MLYITALPYRYVPALELHWMWFIVLQFDVTEVPSYTLPSLETRPTVVDQEYAFSAQSEYVLLPV